MGGFSGMQSGLVMTAPASPVHEGGEMHDLYWRFLHDWLMRIDYWLREKAK